ncbi:MAG: hypothetical protein SHS37scaffold220_45 [Phage 67_12]|nr:MAG: hypothetical protein SHS37scaffold220_45 [Phage 67_12]
MSDDTNHAAPEFVPVPNAPPAAKHKKRTQTTVKTVDPVTSNVTISDVLGEVDLDAVPASATLAAPYAFYDDEGAMHSWAAGQVLVDPDEIAMLLDRGALFTAE